MSSFDIAIRTMGVVVLGTCALGLALALVAEKKPRDCLEWAQSRSVSADGFTARYEACLREQARAASRAVEK